MGKIPGNYITTHQNEKLDLNLHFTQTLQSFRRRKGARGHYRFRYCPSDNLQAFPIFHILFWTADLATDIMHSSLSLPRAWRVCCTPYSPVPYQDGEYGEGGICKQIDLIFIQVSDLVTKPPDSWYWCRKVIAMHIFKVKTSVSDLHWYYADRERAFKSDYKNNSRAGLWFILQL